jgi:hypothetical protein
MCRVGVGAQSKHSVAMTDFWRTFHYDGKISLGLLGWGVLAYTLTLYLLSRTKL